MSVADIVDIVSSFCSVAGISCGVVFFILWSRRF